MPRSISPDWEEYREKCIDPNMPKEVLIGYKITFLAAQLALLSKIHDLGSKTSTGECTICELLKEVTDQLVSIDSDQIKVVHLDVPPDGTVH